MLKCRQKCLLAVFRGAALASGHRRTVLGSHSLSSNHKYPVYGLAIQRWNSSNTNSTSSNSNENDQESAPDTAGENHFIEAIWFHAKPPN